MTEPVFTYVSPTTTRVCTECSRVTATTSFTITTQPEHDAICREAVAAWEAYADAPPGGVLAASDRLDNAMRALAEVTR
jgi:hypothetical protein